MSGIRNLCSSFGKISFFSLKNDSGNQEVTTALKSIFSQMTGNTIFRLSFAKVHLPDYHQTNPKKVSKILALHFKNHYICENFGA